MSVLPISFAMHVQDDNMRQQFDAAMTGSAIVVANGMFGERVVDLLAGHCKMPKTKVFLDSAPRLRARTTMGGISMNLPSYAAHASFITALLMLCHEIFALSLHEVLWLDGVLLLTG